MTNLTQPKPNLIVINGRSASPGGGRTAGSPGLVGHGRLVGRRFGPYRPGARRAFWSLARPRLYALRLRNQPRRARLVPPRTTAGAASGHRPKPSLCAQSGELFCATMQYNIGIESMVLMREVMPARRPAAAF